MSFLDKIKKKLPFEVGKSGSDVVKPTLGKPAGKPKVKAKAVDGTASIIDSAFKTTEKPEDDAILEAPPEIDEDLLEEIEPPKSIPLYVLKGGFVFLVALGIASLVFFTSQLTHTVDFATNAVGAPSILEDLNTTNGELKELQTELNLYRYLQGKFYLDQFSYDGDEYLRNFHVYNNKTISDDERADAYEEMGKLKEKLTESFYAARDKLAKKMSRVLVDLELSEESEFQALFEDLLKKKLAKSANELEESENVTDKKDFKLYKQTQKLVANSELIKLLSDTNFEVLTDEDVVDLILNVNEIVENELSSMQTVKESRINWSDVINQIELETSYVDQYFSKGYYNDIGGIQYTSYDFDTENSKITITGVTKRYDTNNFTMISNLIDKLNSSTYFKGVEMKSFTKSGTAEEGFTAVLRLNLELQKEALNSADEAISLDSLPEFLNPESGVPVEN